ncbi:MAG: phosphonate C-P lyase system protein PhnH [Pseudomonadota bacterium]
MSGAAALAGGFADPPIEAARAFRAVLDAMAQPGTILRVEGAAPPAPLSPADGVVALTLLDPETPLWLAPGLATEAVTAWLRFHTGAPLVDRPEAHFALGDWQAMQPLADWRIGTPDYPDRSTTLIVEMPELAQTGARLSGPGIDGEAHLSLPEVAAFQRNRALFPLGLDFLFTAGDRLAALPRSTIVEG